MNSLMEIIFFLISGVGALWTGFVWPKMESNVNFCEYGNESSLSIKGVEPCKPYEQLRVVVMISLELPTFQSEI
jgi:hypothetical protein